MMACNPNARKITAATNEIITSAPDGDMMRDVVWKSRVCYPSNNALAWGETGGFVPTIVTEGNDMYIFSPLTALSEIAQAWIKGTISADGSRVVFPTPQAYMLNEATPGNVAMLYATRVSAQDGRPVEGCTDLVFSYVDGELVQTDGGLLALTDIQGNFYGYGDMEISVTKIKDTTVALPPEAEVASYLMAFGPADSRQKQTALVACDGSGVYFSDPVGIEDSWFMGTLREDGTVLVATPQYMGSGSGFPLYLVTGSEFKRTEIDPMGNPYEVTDYNVDAGKEIVFTYDPEGKTFTSTQLLLFSSEPDRRGLASAPYMAPLYEPWEMTPLTPKAPTVSYYIDLKEYEAFGLHGCMLAVELPNESVDGEFIPQQNIYYQLAYDNRDVEFYGTSMIPFYGQFQDAATGNAITISGATRQIQTFSKPTSSVSVQSFFECDGQLIPSETNTYMIVDGQLEGEGVESIAEAEVVAVECYDLSGRKISGEEAGFVIRRETLSNGNTRVLKTINPCRR